MQQLRILTERLPALLADGLMLWEMMRLSRSDWRDRWLEAREIGILAALCWLRGAMGPGIPGTGDDLLLPGTGAGEEGWQLLYLVISCGPGLLLLGISALTREQVGRGDGLVLLSLGLRRNPWQVWEICQLSFLLAGAAAAAMLLYSRGRDRGDVRRRDIPFLPVLTPVVILAVTAEWLRVTTGGPG